MIVKTIPYVIKSTPYMYKYALNQKRNIMILFFAQKLYHFLWKALVQIHITVLIYRKSVVVGTSS